MVPTSQWVIRWGCLVLIALGTVIQMIGMASPYWIKDQARPAAYPAFLRLLIQAGGDPPFNITQGTSERGIIRRAEADVGLWRWCVELEMGGPDGEGEESTSYRACHLPDSSDFPGWWKGSQATAVVGTLMGVLACVCGGLELHYLKHGVRFSGLIVLCSVCCFVAALGIGVSHGMFGTKYTETLISIIRLPSQPGWPGVYSLYPPVLGWAFGVGAAGAVLLGSIGIILLAVISRTYPTYQRAENVVV